MPQRSRTAAAVLSWARLTAGYPACPGCGAAQNEVEQCAADPGPPRAGTVPGLQRTTSLRSCCTAPGTRVLSLVNAPPLRGGKGAARSLAGKIAGGKIGLDLHPCIRRNHVVGQRHPLINGD